MIVVFLVDDGEGLTPFDGGENFNGKTPTPLPSPPVDEEEAGGLIFSEGTELAMTPLPPGETLGMVAGAAAPVRDPGTIDRAGGLIPPVPPSCVGCGYCCSQAPCFYALVEYGGTIDGHRNPHPCPGLYWDGERYRCANVDDPMLHFEVAIGAGCCSSMNTWRGVKIERRPEIENPLPHHGRVV